MNTSSQLQRKSLQTAASHVHPAVAPVLSAALLCTWQLGGLRDIPIVLLLLPVLQFLPLATPGIGARTRAVMPLVMAASVAATLVFWTDDTGRMCGIGVAMVAQLWSSPSRARYELSITATAGCLAIATILTAQGAPGPVILSTSAIALIGAVIDTERSRVRRLTEELEESRLRLEMALAQGQAGVFDVDLHTGAATFSPRFREVLGYDGFSAFPPLPTTIDSDDLVWHEDLRQLRAALVRARRTAGTVDEELRLVSATGHPLWVRLRGTARMAPDGEVARFVGSILDVSARRSADELAEGFLQAASRQIRAPLTSIRGVHRMLGSGAFGQMSDLGARMVAIADRNSARLEDLVEHLIELRRLQRGALVMESVLVDLDEVVDAAVSDAISQYGSALHIDTRHGGGSRAIHADPTRLRTALCSLIGAAFDETSATGSVEVTTEAADGMVTVALTRSGHADDQVLHEGIAALLTGNATPLAPGFDTVGIEVARAVVLAMGGQLAATVRPAGGLTIAVSFASTSEHTASTATTHRGEAS